MIVLDKFYVLDLTNNLDSLESDYNNWMNLPYDFRMRSDDECIKRLYLRKRRNYNVKNRDYDGRRL